MSLRKVRVKTISQQVYEFEVSESMTIAAFKEQIFLQTQVPIDRQRLIYMGKMIQDQQTIGEIVKEDNQTIHLMAMTQPPQQQPQPQQQQQQQQQQQRLPQQGGFQNVIQMQFSTLGGQQQPPEGLNQLTDSIQNIIGTMIRSTLPNQPQQQQQQGGQQRSNTHSQPVSQPQQPTTNQHHSHSHPHPHVHVHNHGNEQQLQEVQIGDSQPLQSSVQPISLPFNILHHLSRTVDTAFGQQAVFPGPPLPQIPNRNSIQLLGSYLHNLCFGVQRALPLIERTADLLQREPQMTNPQDRRQTERLARLSANLLVDIQRAIGVFNLLRLLQLGDQPGQGRLYVPRRDQPNQAQQHQQQQQQQPVQQSQQQQPSQQQSQSQSITDEPEEVITDIHNIQIQLGDDNNVQPVIDGVLQLGMSGLSQLPNILSSLFNPPPQGQAGGQQQQQQPQQQMHPQPPQVIPLPNDTNQQGVQGQNPPSQMPAAMNPLSMIGSLLGNLGGGQQNQDQAQQGPPQNLFTMTVRDILVQNYQNQFEEGDQELLEIFGDVKVGDIMGAQMTGNWSFLDNLHPRIKTQLRNQIEQAGGELNLAKKLGASVITFLCPEEQDQHRVLEGFEPPTVANDIINRNLIRMFQIIDRDYTGQVARFSNELIAAFKHMVGECVYELSEGLNNGIEDYKIIFMHNTSSFLSRTVGPELAQLAQMMLNDMVWNQCLRAYEHYRVHLEQQEQIQQQRQQQGQLTEEQLLAQIEQLATEQKFQRYQDIQLSDEYKKGDPSYKEF